MKKLIAATVIALSAVSAHAESFDFERQFGTPELFSTLVTDGIATRSGGSSGSPVFAHERAFGAVELYPTLISEQIDYNVNLDSRALEPFHYWVNVWNTDVEIGG